jgi:hypothetical protein
MIVRMQSRQSVAVQNFGSGIAVFAAVYCYAKIAPALRRRGRSKFGLDEIAEDTATIPKIAASEVGPGGSAARVATGHRLRMAEA